MSAAVRTCPQCGTEYGTDIKFCPKDGSTLRVPPGAALIGSVIADRYHILRKLGEGGMGQVFLAEHVKMGRLSAIKVMAPAMIQDTDAISRFNREASNASRINHPNVAAIYDFGETPDGLIYLAMEYVEGEPLTDIIARTGPLPPARATSIISQTAGALDAAHERGIVHRDLKPDNIMIGRQRDGSDLVKVVDFGIAKSQTGAGQKVTKTGLVVGTPEYMSPEQLSGDAVDARSDTFALALVAFHLLTGSLPYDEGSAQETLIRRLTDKPRTLAEVRPGIAWPPVLEGTIARALERDAARRPTSSGAFAAEFTAALQGVELAYDEGTTRTVNTVPATRVDDASPTSIAPKPTRSAPLPTAKAVAAKPPARRGRRWLFGGIGAAAAALFLAVASRGRPSAATTKPTNGTKTFAHPIDSGAVPEPSGAAGGASDTPRTARAVPPRSVPNAAPKPAPPPAPLPPAPLVAPANEDPKDGPREKRVRLGLENADHLVLDQKPGQALLVLRRVIPEVTTHRDSVRAFVLLSEALLQNSQRTGDTAMKSRACDILLKLRQDPTRVMASRVEADYDQQCK